MNNYIHKIIDFFFHHEVSDEITERVYNRMVFPVEDKAREEAVSQIWDKLDDASCSDEKIEKAFYNLETSLGLKKEEQTVELVHREHIRNTKRINWGRVAAIWTIPFIMVCFSAYYYYSAKDYVKETLSEGSKVWLNAGTLLVYPSSFISESRNVYIAGEGFFEVSKDKEHPFIVTTNHLELEVLGTTFNISAYPDNNQIMATLETGRLQVKVNKQPEKYFLEPNDQLIYTPSTGIVQQHKVNAVSHSDWRMGGLFFGNVPFNDVLHTLERVYGVKFHVRTSIYQNQSLRVHFNRNESLEQVLQIIKILVPGIEYEIVGKNIYLR